MSLAGRPRGDRRKRKRKRHIPWVPMEEKHLGQALAVLQSRCDCGGARGLQKPGSDPEIVCLKCGKIALRIRPRSAAERQKAEVWYRVAVAADAGDEDARTTLESAADADRATLEFDEHDQASVVRTHPPDQLPS